MPLGLLVSVKLGMENKRRLRGVRYTEVCSKSEIKWVHGNDDYFYHVYGCLNNQWILMGGKIVCENI